MNEIFTIGYGGRETDEFIALLNEYEIDTLVDVRSQPYSRFAPDFSKERLSAILSRNGIQYEFMGKSLGGRPADSHCYTYSPQRKKKLLDAKKCESRDFYQRGISQLKRALSIGRRIVIMCSELEPHECHRGYVLGKTLDSDEIAVTHIGRYGEPLSQSQIRETNYQEALL
ncbi:MAG: DUF488 domain-containing protein [Chloroflexota bacterium]|nr:DUF488 domain-containing protein [Chloroflexota bacterium]MDE2909705.1 DUF488 domain-containing protein [Chloroflexota bacterium]